MPLFFPLSLLCRQIIESCWVVSRVFGRELLGLDRWSVPTFFFVFLLHLLLSGVWSRYGGSEVS